ncbi:MAG: hypothetical protein KDI52_03685 [Xanthomonadales bacterium]|nr:hypothetical protein [Xanthomonadales bacterium]
MNNNKFLIFIVSLIFINNAYSEILIDDFSADQPLLFAIGAGGSASSFVTTAGSEILGTERDIELTVVSGAVVSGEVTGNALNFSVAAATTGEGLIMWDGVDGLPSAVNLNPTGLGGIDMTQSGTLDSFRVNILSSDQPGTMILTVYTDGGNFSSATVAIPVSAVALDIVIPYSSFSPQLGTGADFTNVGAVTMFVSGFEIDTRISLIQAESSLSATMTDALLVDNDSDSSASPGDTLRYTVVINNPDDAFDATVTNVSFSIPFIENTSLVLGSVTTTQGTVITGNGGGGGDSIVEVDTGDIVDDTSVTITFDVNINSPVASSVTLISAQGLIEKGMAGQSILTDDPDTMAANDRTITPIIKTTLGDFVWNDVNGNSVQDGGEPGIDGVTLNAYWDVNNDGMVDGGDLFLGTTSTTGGGLYSFGLPNFGIFLIDVTDTSAVLDGYVLTTLADPIQVSYPSGSTANDLDFGYQNQLIIPDISINDVSANEGNTGISSFTFTVSLSGESPNTITVDYATVADTALEGSDYVGASGTLTFNPREVSKTLDISVMGDITFEADQNFSVVLTSTTNANFGDDTGVGTIINDDTVPDLNIVDVSVTEGDSGNTITAFTVQMSNASEQDVYVDFVTAEVTATADVDYVTTAGTLTIPANSLQGLINVSVIGDYSIESDEQFNVNLNNPVNASIFDNSATGTILDDDLGADLSLTMNVSPTEIQVNGILTHHLIVTNNGPEDALDTFAELNLSPLLDYMNSSSDQGVCTHTTGIVSCDLGTIPANQSVNIFIEAKVNAAGAVNSSATVYSSTSDDVNLANNNASAGVIADPLVIPVLSDFSLFIFILLTMLSAYRFNSQRLGKTI